MKTPQEIVDIMMNGDLFSQWMDVKIVSIGLGQCTLSCTTKAEMLNGFAILHGGITYSLSDSALAFASNSYGHKCVSIETSISHLVPVQNDTELIAQCTEVSRGKTLGIYMVEIRTTEGTLVSNFKGTVNISKEIW